MSGCATLSKQECQTADWQIIGMEDGASGKPASFVGEHRKACAEYGIAPDLAAYQKGHAKGLKEYCNYDNGYRLAESGGAYNQVCTQADYPLFVQGFQRGAVAYQHLSEIRKLQDAKNDAAKRLEEVKALIKEKEALIIADASTSQQRKVLLEEVTSLNLEMTELNATLAMMEVDIGQAQNRYEQFRQSP
ncbi:DUF2799 domain-containing protein [Aliiglaciecola sp. CAU 1673]|uniref:DUF2799 domain-containing protein n=1 Tax=Aliiglaciecola sp. CAU 1673 TaxID=3032595 RepID=UPI0023DB3054|nr:DUF2799 domain-containing protein [Aliiglaciecola sp. CAU 1673]MDF2177972.1 DUF2799 domain-containing protein [Aliiglaciecola sp. CAU 1673]